MSLDIHHFRQPPFYSLHYRQKKPSLSFCAKLKGEVAESKNKKHKPLRLGKRSEQTMGEGPGGRTIE